MVERGGDKSFVVRTEEVMLLLGQPPARIKAWQFWNSPFPVVTSTAAATPNSSTCDRDGNQSYM